MEKQHNKIRKMIEQVDQLTSHALEHEKKHEAQLKKIHPNFQLSARNLIHYRAIRTMDIRGLQKKLGNMGISRLGKAESHVLASLKAVKGILEGFIKEQPINIERNKLSIKKSKSLLRTNAKNLLGYRSKGRRTRIMVTLPTDAAFDYKLVHDLIANGMNCARINCAHDDAEVWKLMIENVRKAAQKLKRNCKIAMDLGGPKIRTGQLKEGPKVKKYRPAKDTRGYIVKPLKIWIGPEPNPDAGYQWVPASLEELGEMENGARLYFKDARNKKRTFLITEKREEGYFGECPQTTYLETGLLLYKDSKRKAGRTIQVGQLPALEQPLLLGVGDRLHLRKATTLGLSAQYDENGTLISPAVISCTSPEIFKSVQAGERILFDDGKINGIIKAVNKEEIIVEMKYARGGIAKLRGDKDINLPDSDLQISGLTEKDRMDLKFVAKHADVINFSFVNQPEDVRDLIAELKSLDAKENLGIILKIETQKGFNNLTEILLEAMQGYPVGVMIARGDLAIETGWDNIGRIQEEILSLCQAAHIPEIWATQVLENLAKLGIPSRAEITDAAMAQRADCVMLNKGPYILNAIQLLSTILKDMEPYWEKNAPMMPSMK